MHSNSTSYWYEFNLIRLSVLLHMQFRLCEILLLVLLLCLEIDSGTGSLIL